jgi:hypothetical protein
LLIATADSAGEICVRASFPPSQRLQTITGVFDPAFATTFPCTSLGKSCREPSGTQARQRLNSCFARKSGSARRTYIAGAISQRSPVGFEQVPRAERHLSRGGG